ncbi:hypothetical protein FRC01_002253 [Tulasnella sp. 417]|nr:hypothetical protein FRC01_002253 [Tulasnella sp. 417]
MPPKQKMDQRPDNNSNNRQTPSSNDNAVKGAKDGDFADIPGLPQLVALVQTIAATPPGKEPEIDPDTLDVLENTPLNVVYDALKPVFLKLGIAEAAVEAKSPWSKTSGHVHETTLKLKAIEEKVDSLSKNTDEGFKNTLHEADLKGASQTLGEKIVSCHDETTTMLRTSAKDTNDQLKGIEKEASSPIHVHDIRDLDAEPAVLSAFTQVKAVPVAVNSEITALDAKFAELRKELVEDAKGRVERLEDKNEELKRELKELRDVVDATSFALVPVKFALESAISGYFPTSNEAKAACVDAFHAFIPTDVEDLAEVVRGEVFQLVARCQALFSVLSGPQAESSSIIEIGGGFEEPWARALESAHGLHVDAQISRKKEQESLHKLSFFGFLVDQVRDGQYSLDQWAEASQRQDYGDYMDQPFDGFDALQTVAEEIQQLRRKNAHTGRSTMPPKNNNSSTSWWSARQQAPETPTRETRTLNNNNGPGPADARNPEEMPGMPELIEFISALAAATPGTKPQLNGEQIERIKKSPLKPVLQALQPIYRKIVEAPVEPEKPPEPQPPAPQPTSSPGPDPSSAQRTPPVAALDVAELKNVEAELKSLSSKLDSVSQAVTDVTKQREVSTYFETLEDNLRKEDSDTRDAVQASARASKAQFETVDNKVSQLSGKLDPALTELTQGIKKLQVGLLGDVKAERTRLEAKVTDLEKELKALQQVIDATKAELLPVEVASKIALQGTFSDELDKTSTRAGAGNTTGNVVQTAKRVRTNTLGLITKCRALFTFINRDPETGTNGPDLGTEGEWGRCADHLRASNSRLRGAIEEKEESAQRMQFVGFVVDQLRKGNYTEKEWKKDANGKKFAALIEKSPDGFASIQLLAQDLSRITKTAMTVPVVPAPVVQAPVVQAVPATPITPSPVPPTPTPPTTAPLTTDTPVTITAPTETKTRGGKITSGTRGAAARGNPPTAEPASATTTSSTAAVSKGPAPLTASATSKTSAANTPSTPLPTPPATAAFGALSGTKSATRGIPTTAQSTAATNGPTSSTGQVGSKASAARTTAPTPKTPVVPVTPAPPRSPSPVTAPSSPVITIAPIPEKKEPELGYSPSSTYDRLGGSNVVEPLRGVAPTKKSSSHFRTKSGFNRTPPGPLSGWGPLVG